MNYFKILILSLIVVALPFLASAALDQNILRSSKAELEDQSISKTIGGFFSYIFSPGNETGLNKDIFYHTPVILQDENQKAVTGHSSCTLVNRSEESKIFTGETVMYNTDNLPIDADLACVLFNRGGENLLVGNVYSKREITNPFTLKEGVAISGEKVKEGVLDRLSGYDIEPGSTAKWDNGQEYKNVFMRSNIMKWRDQRATELDFAEMVNHFHLNPKGADAIRGSAGREADENYPEGRTWYRDGNFTIRGGAVEFGGRGTIIVEGNLTIDVDSLTPYNGDTDMLGFIVLPKGGSGGNVEITNKVKDLKASFFTPGKIDDAANADTGLPSSGVFHIQGSDDPDENIEITGSIVANGVDLRESRFHGEGNYGIKIKYDERLGKIPPPGFTREMIASFQESAP